MPNSVLSRIRKLGEVLKLQNPSGTSGPVVNSMVSVVVSESSNHNLMSNDHPSVHVIDPLLTPRLMLLDLPNVSLPEATISLSPISSQLCLDPYNGNCAPPPMHDYRNNSSVDTSQSLARVFSQLSSLHVETRTTSLSSPALAGTQDPASSSLTDDRVMSGFQSGPIRSSASNRHFLSLPRISSTQATSPIYSNSGDCRGAIPNLNACLPLEERDATRDSQRNSQPGPLPALSSKVISHAGSPLPLSGSAAATSTMPLKDAHNGVRSAKRYNSTSAISSEHSHDPWDEHPDYSVMTLRVLLKPSDLWQYLGYLGGSSKGHACLAFNFRRRKAYAVKILDLRRPENVLINAMDAIAAELHVLHSRSDSPFVLQGPHHTEHDPAYWFSNDNLLHIVSDYYPGDLRRYRGQTREPALQTVFAEIFLGLKYLHSKGIVHRDIEPGNILVGSDGHCTISGFGSVSLESGILKWHRNPSWTKCLSPYAAPELYINRGGYICFNQTTDYYALAIVVFDLAMGLDDYGSVDLSRMLYNGFQVELVELLAKIHSESIAERPSMIQIERHIYFNPDKDFWQRIQNKEYPPPFKTSKSIPVSLVIPSPAISPSADCPPVPLKDLLSYSLRQHGNMDIRVPLGKSIAFYKAEGFPDCESANNYDSNVNGT